MYLNKHAAILLLLIMSVQIFSGCINPSSRVGYTIDVTPSEGSETTLIIPLVTDNISGEIDKVMFVNPRFPKGNASLKIIETSKGPALKIVTYETIEIKFSERYNEKGVELITNKTLSMTEFNYDEKGKPVIKSWIYINSTKNNVPFFWITMSAGAEKSRLLEISGENVSNGWHQIDVEEGYAIAE